jgi:N-acetylneuraminic acid mutarotase
MKQSVVLFFALAWCATQCEAAQKDEPVIDATKVEWEKLPRLPDHEGFGGMFAGTCGDSLVVCGGANFPDKLPWDGGTKVWYDKILVLDRPDGTWRTMQGKMPRPLGYGVSVTWDGAVICAGGCDLERHYTDVFAVRLVDGDARIETLPAMPQPCANMCGGIVGSRLYVAGGTISPTATVAMKNFWCLDLAARREKLAWKELEPWPGMERSHAVAAVLDKSFFLASGFRWKAGPHGEQERVSPFLVDSYRFTPQSDGAGVWKRLADLPRAFGGAPTPAMVLNSSCVVVAGGVDDKIGGMKQSTHPGFSSDVFCFNAVTNKWEDGLPMPAGAARTTAPTAIWQGRHVIVSGERAPGRRSPELFTAQVQRSSQATNGHASP